MRPQGAELDCNYFNVQKPHVYTQGARLDFTLGCGRSVQPPCDQRKLTPPCRKTLRSALAPRVYPGWANQLGQIVDQEVRHACSVCDGECDA